MQVIDMKICLICSSGGHFTELTQLEEAYKDYDHFFVTIKKPDTEEFSLKEKVFFVKDPKRNPFKLMKNIIQSFSILLKERPNVIISLGAGVTIPICFFGKFFLKSELIFIESFARVKSKSIAGKILYPISDLFLVQWEETKKLYGNRAKYYGGIY